MCMKFYDDTTLLYLEIDASGIGLGAALLQLRDNTGCQKDAAPDNTILHPIAFVSKSLTGGGQRYVLVGKYLLLQITSCWYPYSRK